MQVIVMDTETTGFEFVSNSLVEIAAVDLDTSQHFSSLIKPRHPISFGAMATHHITEEMVADAPELDDVLRDKLPPDRCFTLAFHNAKFDRDFLPADLQALPYVCTWRCALHLFPEAESHSNQSLRYELGIDISDMPDLAGQSAHRALYDAWTTRGLLRHMRDVVGKTVEELIELSKAPVMLRKVRFGKHQGELWEDVPKSYLRWILGQDFDEDVIHTARSILG